MRRTDNIFASHVASSYLNSPNLKVSSKCGTYNSYIFWGKLWVYKIYRDVALPVVRDI